MALELLKNHVPQNYVYTAARKGLNGLYRCIKCNSIIEPYEKGGLWRHVCNKCGFQVGLVERHELWLSAKEEYPELIE